MIKTKDDNKKADYPKLVIDTVDDEEMKKKIDAYLKPHEAKAGLREWLSLILILLVSISNQWQRSSLAYAANHATGNKNDPFYNINVAYP